MTTPWVTTLPESDFTAQWQLEGLKPDREYAAVVEARPSEAMNTTAVMRAGFERHPGRSTQTVNFCMTTCHDFIRRDDGLERTQDLSAAMPKMDPDFVVHAGDIEYYDKPDPWAWTIGADAIQMGQDLLAAQQSRLLSANDELLHKGRPRHAQE